MKNQNLFEKGLLATYIERNRNAEKRKYKRGQDVYSNVLITDPGFDQLKDPVQVSQWSV